MTFLRRVLSHPPALHVTALAAYLAATLVLTWPLALHINTHVPGRNVDEYAFLWNIWWFKYAIFDLGQSPLHTDFTFYPLGVNLALYTLGIFNDLVALPFHAFLSIPTISNLIIILSFALSGYGTFLLCRYLLRDDPSPNPSPHRGGVGGGETAPLSLAGRGAGGEGGNLAAFVGGMVYAFASCRFVYASLGHYNVVSSEWIPFYMLFLLKTVRRGRWRDAVLAGVFALLCLLCENTFGVFLALLTLAVLLFEWRRLVRSDDFPETAEAVTTNARRWRLRQPGLRKLLQLATVGLVAFAGYLPLAIPILQEMTRAQEYSLKGWGGAEWLAADALGLFIPTALHPLWGGAAEAMDVQFKDTHTVFLGYALPLLALVGAITYRKRLKLWITVAVASLLLALGPLLTVGGQQVFGLDGLEVTVPLPFILLHYIPVINANRTPNRFSLTLMMALGVLVAFAVAWLLAKISKPTRSGLRQPQSPSPTQHESRITFHALRFTLALTLASLIAFEHLAVPLPLTDVRIPPIYWRIAAETDDYAILQLPLGWRNSFGTQGAERTQIQYYQVVHHKRILGGNTSRNPDYKFEYFARLPVVKSIIDLEMYREVSPAQRAIDEALAGELVYLLDIRYVVMHPPIPGRLPYADTYQSTEEYVKSVLALELLSEDATGVRAYRVIQPPPTTTLTTDFGVAATQMYRGEGWSWEEDIGGVSANWANAREARVFLPARLPGDYRLSLVAMPFTWEGSPRQRATVWVNGRALPERIVFQPGWGSYELRVPAGYVKLTLNTVTFEFDYAESPYDRLPGNFAIGSTGVNTPVDIKVNSVGGENGFAHIGVGRDSDTDISVERRGYNLVVLDERTGAVLDRRGFDTAGSPAESRLLAEYIAGIPEGRIVVAAVRIDGGRHLTEQAVAALRTIGARADLRGTENRAHAIIGVKGAASGTALELAPVGNAFLYVGHTMDQRTLAVAVDGITWARE